MANPHGWSNKRLNQRTEGPRINRLADVSVETGVQQALAVAVHGLRRHRDNGQTGERGVPSDLAEERLPATAGDLDVQQEEVRTGGQEPLPPFVHRRGRVDVVAPELQDVPHEPEVERIVFDDQDSSAHAMTSRL